MSAAPVKRTSPDGRSTDDAGRAGIAGEVGASTGGHTDHNAAAVDLDHDMNDDNEPAAGVPQLVAPASATREQVRDGSGGGVPAKGSFVVVC